MLLFLSTVAFAAPLESCDRSYRTTELNDALESAEFQFTKQDAEGFASSAQVVAVRVACFAEPLAPEVLARVYLVEALEAFLAGNDAGVAPALAAMVSASPGFQVPTKLVPDGHPLRRTLVGATLLLREPVVVSLGTRSTGWVEVDGAHRTEAPTNRDVVLQRFGPDGQVAETAYVHVGESLDAWVAASPVAVPAVKPKPVEPAAPPTPLPLVPHRPFALRASVGAVGGGLGEPTDDSPGGLGGPGARVAIGAELGAGRIGGYGEIGWMGVLGLAPTDASAQSLTVGGGAQLRIGAATIEAGPVWLLSFVHAEGLACTDTGCGGQAEIGVAEADGVLMSGGGTLAADVRLGGQTSIVALELQLGAVTDLVRPTAWGGVGVRLGRRCAE